MLSLFQSIKSQHDEEREARLYRELIRKEAKLGGTLFGPVPANVRREFFCLDKNTWVWHEEWTDNQGQRRSITTRYDVRPDGVLKAQDGKPYTYIDIEEGKRLYKTVKLYRKLIGKELYNLKET
jgi:hypothetical protein